MREKGTIALVIPVALLIIAAVIFLVFQGVIKTSLNNINLPGSKKEPTVTLQSQYQNPFDKSAQYVNPFSSYKNPFDLLK